MNQERLSEARARAQRWCGRGREELARPGACACPAPVVCRSLVPAFITRAHPTRSRRKNYLEQSARVFAALMRRRGEYSWLVGGK